MGDRVEPEVDGRIFEKLNFPTNFVRLFCMAGRTHKMRHPIDGHDSNTLCLCLYGQYE